MRNILLLMTIALVVLGCSSDNDNETAFDIWCGAELSEKKQSCMFFFFEEGEYISVERKDLNSSVNDFGRATATKKDGSIVNAIGYAYYSSLESGYATAYYHDWSEKKLPQREIREGTFYVACFPTQIGYRHPYKASICTKAKNKGLLILPKFTANSYYGVDGYKYFGWDE